MLFIYMYIDHISGIWWSSQNSSTKRVFFFIKTPPSSSSSFFIEEVQKENATWILVDFVDFLVKSGFLSPVYGVVGMGHSTKGLARF